MNRAELQGGGVNYELEEGEAPESLIVYPIPRHGRTEPVALLFPRPEDAQAFYAGCDERTTIFTSEPIAS